MIKALLFFFVCATAVFGESPTPLVLAGNHIESMIKHAQREAFSPTDPSRRERWSGVEALIHQVFAELVAEFRWDMAKRESSFTVKAENGDWLNRRRDVTHSVIVTTERHVIRIRLRYDDPSYPNQFLTVGFNLELREAR